MEVPDYQSHFRAVSDGKAHGLAEVRSSVAVAVGLSDEDLALTIPRGKPLANGRTDWAFTYLTQVGPHHASTGPSGAREDEASG